MLVLIRFTVFCFIGVLLFGCEGPVGPEGEQGVAGPAGLRGEYGIAGADGSDALSNIVYIRLDLDTAYGEKPWGGGAWVLEDSRIRVDNYVGVYFVMEVDDSPYYLRLLANPYHGGAIRLPSSPLYAWVRDGAIFINDIHKNLLSAFLEFQESIADIDARDPHVAIGILDG